MPMGKQYKIQCFKCGYSIRLTLGIGMMYSPRSVFCENHIDKKPLLLAMVRSKRIKMEALALLDQGATPAPDYGHEAYICPKCHRLSNRFYFRLLGKDGEYEPDYRCFKCRTLLKRADMKAESGRFYIVFKEDDQDADWACPNCGNKEMVVGWEMGLWD